MQMLALEDLCISGIFTSINSSLLPLLPFILEAFITLIDNHELSHLQHQLFIVITQQLMFQHGEYKTKGAPGWQGLKLVGDLLFWLVKLFLLFLGLFSYQSI
jgi:hypothetical protein